MRDLQHFFPAIELPIDDIAGRFIAFERIEVNHDFVSREPLSINIIYLVPQGREQQPSHQVGAHHERTSIRQF